MTLQQLYKNAEPDHAGHAECVIATFPDKFRYTESHGWFFNNGKFWTTEGAIVELSNAIRQVLRQRQTIARQHKDKKLDGKSSVDQWTMNGVKGAMMQMPGIYTEITEFDSDPHLLNCINGIVDLRNGILVPHYPGSLFSYCIPIEYDPNADRSEWENFLYSQNHPAAVLYFLQVFSGYCLTGNTNEEIAAYFYGVTRSGKGVFTETLAYLLQDLAQGVNFRMFTADRSGDTQNFDLAPLKNKRLIVAGEQNRKEALNDAVIKMITGGDMIYCAFKHKQHFSYRPQFKVMMTSNYMVNADPADDAVWGRLRIVPFKYSFLGQEDKGLKMRLREPENIQGVLAWAVQGAVTWYSKGMPYPDEMKEEMKAHRSEASSVIAFVTDSCEFKKDEVTTITNIYNLYKAYCADEGHGTLGRRRFKAEMESIYKMVEQRKAHGGKVQRIYEGIKLV